MIDLDAAKETTTTSLAMTTQARDMLTSLVIDSPERSEMAADALRMIKGRYNELEKQRKTITAPLLEAKKAADALFKPAKDALLDFERSLKQKIADHLQRTEAANRRALEAVAGTADEVEAATQLAMVQDAAPPTGVNIRYVMRVMIKDASKVPREFCSPDPTLLKPLADAGLPAPPGVEFFKEAITSVRGAK